MCKAWQDLHTQYSTELIVCNTAATKRGLLTADEVESTQAHNLQAPFVAGGLAEFATLSQSVDKVVQF